MNVENPAIQALQTKLLAVKGRLATDERFIADDLARIEALKLEVASHRATIAVLERAIEAVDLDARSRY